MFIRINGMPMQQMDRVMMARDITSDVVIGPSPIEIYESEKEKIKLANRKLLCYINP